MKALFSSTLLTSAAVFYDSQAARAAGNNQRAAELADRMPALQQAAAALTVPNAFGALLQRQGAVGLNASTSHVRAVSPVTSALYLDEHCRQTFSHA
jgi:hypothetical protein